MSAKTTDFAYLGLTDKVVAEEIAGQLDRTYQYDAYGRRLTQQKKDTDGSGPEVTEDNYYGYNPHTDVETLTTSTGDTKATYGYTAYGNNDTEAFTGIDKPDTQNPDKDPFNYYRYTGKRYDPASGSYDMGFRDYQPNINRFTVRDTYNGALNDLNLTTNPWTGNRYALAGGNPITGIEIDGHTPCVNPGDCDGYVYKGPDIGLVPREPDSESTSADEKGPSREDSFIDVIVDPDYEELAEILGMMNTEMNRNPKSSTGQTIRRRLSEGCSEFEIVAGMRQRITTGRECNLAALLEWADKVWPGAEWDHKERILSNFNMRERNDVFTPLPTGDKIRYDIWSNIHYGYVGTDVGFSADILDLGANLADIGGRDRTDSGDQIAVEIGIDLRKKYSPNQLSPAVIYQAVISRYDDLRDAGMIIPQ